MTNIINIGQHKRHSYEVAPHGTHETEDVEAPDIDNSMNGIFWPDPPHEDMGELIANMFDPRIAAIMIKGCFGLYHLVREHRRRRTRVPGYLLQFARDCEEPIIPAAEVTYFRYYCEGGKQPEDIPDDLYLLGCVECEDPAKCTCHALRLHRLLEAFAGADRTAQRDFLEVFPAEESRPFMRAMFAEHRLRAAAKGKLSPI